MTRIPDMWETMMIKMIRGKWYPLEDIYRIISNNIILDDEDYEPAAPKSDHPKWKRNVRNVLQHRRKSGDIEWNGNGMYKI